MGKKIIWSSTSLRQLEKIHEDIFNVSKSLNIANRVIDDILESSDVLSSQAEIYTLDENKLNNDGSYRSYETITSQKKLLNVFSGAFLMVVVCW
jgi:plasmid stabilization system protein ParE